MNDTDAPMDAAPERADRRVLAALQLRNEADVVAARQAARRVVELLGLDRHDQTRVATAVSEVARNAVAYAGGGEVVFAVQPPVQPERLSVLVHDGGPGIADVDEVLSGRKPFAPGYGKGLVNARRLVDAFDLQTGPQGTRVQLTQRIARAAAARLGAGVLQAIGPAVRAQRPDAVAAVHEQNRELIESLHDLRERSAEAERLSRELEETNRGVVALYSELEHKAEQLRNVSDLKSRFLSHMSHEFRTPLNSILALARLLLDGVDGSLAPEQGRQVEYIRRSAQGLLDMVNDLLDLAKVEAGRLDVKPQLFSVADLFIMLRGALRPLLGNPAVELVFDAPVGVPDLYQDESKVAQILRNLVANALRFTEAGTVRVSASHDAAAGRVEIAVSDTGIGIAAEAQEAIFEEFSQVEGRLQRGGTGLGLPLSRRLATLMGGTLTLTSVPEQGSTFRLGLPVRFGQPAPPPAPAADRAAVRVLVIDDEEAFRYIIRHIAQDAGYEVIEAPDGAAGLELARARPPDAVILDLHMPRLDGLATLDAMRHSQALRDTPVIVCTAQALALEHKRALSSAYAIVPKHQVSRDGLTALIEAALGRRGSTRQASMEHPA